MEQDQFIPGLHAVKEVLLGGTGIKELWVTANKTNERLAEILQLAGERRVPIVYKTQTELERLFPDLAHQGVVALAEPFAYCDLSFLIKQALKKTDAGLLLAADHITDEGNLGALIRTAASFGAHGLILPRDRSAQITAKVLKRSSGAHVFLPITQVVNLGRTLDELNKNGFWVIGAAGESAYSIYEFDWRRNLVLVLGSEDKGLKPSTRSHCHQLVGIPVQGFRGSLNVSVAGGVILSEILRQRAYVR
ncbi:MAG: 23S rRNA (guanosine(2251)-2'-O)-methyltransferase RlmB [Desulfobacteraceae bacterium]|nr:MAG: 23S rRNA (guanosine(2251)-2'-O)-methyltransferase RlmB [Desulfobacteraceae bacterium]